jgi:plastocyanin
MNVRSIGWGSSFVIVALAFPLAGPGVYAQTGCRTANCAPSTTPPAGCGNRAAPYTMSVAMTDQLVFIPQNPKIEPGDCILWVTTGSQHLHSSSADNCTDSNVTCTTPDPTCQWESGNVAFTDSPPSETCFYDVVNFPAGVADGFYCRIHSSPSHANTMFGSLRITTPIDLQVSKNLGTGDIVLSWTGGGVTGDVTYKVVRNLAADPLFTAGANTVTGDPDGGSAGTAFTELGGLSDPGSHYYLIRNRQISE